MDVGRLCILLAGFWRASKQLGPPFPPMKRSFSSSHERKEFHGLFLPPLSPIFSVDFGGKEGKSRLAGNYEAAVLLRPQSPCDFYSPFQEVVRNRTTVQYHKKRRKRRGRKNILAVSDDPWHARFYDPRWRMQSMVDTIGWRNEFHSRSKEILSQINFQRGVVG